MILRNVEHRQPRPATGNPREDSTQKTEAALGLTRQLCESLARRGVSYVHWKSNINIDQALWGVDDLDLLVDRRDACSFREVLGQLRFREAADARTKQIPGIQHYYGLDEATGIFVHVHAHFQLVVGHDATKNYHLPLERAFLDSATNHDLIALPSVEVELLVYALRMVLKFSWYPNPLSGYDRTGRHRELEFLEHRADRAQLDRILQEHLPCVDLALFDACLRCARPGTSNGFRFRTRGRLHRALRAYARRHRFVDGWLKTSRQVTALTRRTLHLPKPKRSLTDGGVILAIVGGDGAGKTTVIRHLQDRYRKVTATRTMHLGKPKRSWMSRIVRHLDAIHSRWTRLVAPQTAGRNSARTGRVGLVRSLRYALKARDRYFAYARARRFATAGGIVICDRWPVPGFQLMEAPQLFTATPSANGGKCHQALQRRESHYHQIFPDPDRLVVLRLDPEVAVARRPYENGALLRIRSQEVWDFNWDSLDAHVVDASRPLPEVVREVLAITWKAV